MKIKDEPPEEDEAEESQSTQNDLEVKSEIDEDNFDDYPDQISPSSSANNVYHFLDPIPSPEPIIYERPPPTATIVSRKSRKDPYQLFICPKCGIKICSELERQEHMMTVHDPKKKKNQKKAKLKPSPAAIDGKNEWMCTYCSKCFASKFDMLLHRKREHQRE